LGDVHMITKEPVKQHNERPTLAISFGGSKVALGLVGSEGRQILQQSERIEWCLDTRFDPQHGFESLMSLVADEAARLFASAEIDPAEVCQVGVAWPGPGRYDEGWLYATFLPDLANGQNVHRALIEALSARLRIDPDSLRCYSRLDVNARAIGEVRLAYGALFTEDGERPRSGLVLNVATGIAGACVRSGQVLATWGDWGETYGQWGRYAFRDSASGLWRWCPTPDGSIPAHTASEVRLTQYCGGPALARCYNNLCATQWPQERDIKLERECLIRISRTAYEGDRAAAEFVTSAGRDVGAAVRCIIHGLGAGEIADELVLTGGVGEFFGRPERSDSGPDLYLCAIATELTGYVMHVHRSQAGLDAELAGLA